ncbi:hypothetical protein ACFWZ2_21500 [Streptomyces sp. NPDC059002]|uniref:hypothetical protein n=1 Tax=Streptomyces sp. NPDC059002 TaxID=3346690 RepID=UPI00367FFEF2
MKLTVQLVIDHQDGTALETHEVGTLKRAALTPATAGLHLAEAHEVLAAIQQRTVAAQAAHARESEVPPVAWTPGHWDM